MTFSELAMYNTPEKKVEFLKFTDASEAWKFCKRVNYSPWADEDSAIHFKKITYKDNPETLAMLEDGWLLDPHGLSKLK